MKLPKVKIKPEVGLTIATMALGLAQLVLTNKKEANEKSMLKAEIMEELTNNFLEKKD